MEVLQLNVLLRLLVAHLLADFIFQTDKTVEEKKKGLASKFFYTHIIAVGLLTYIIYGQWTNWWAPLIIMASHAAIDLFKHSARIKSPWDFIADQILHIISIIFLWILVSTITISDVWRLILCLELNNTTLIIAVSYMIVSLPVSVLIGRMTIRWQNEFQEESNEGLKDAGKWIGILERFLVLTFILIDQWAALGFLLAGKSIFRIGDLNKVGERKKTEYILIGTLLSFTSSIVTGLITYKIIH